MKLPLSLASCALLLIGSQPSLPAQTILPPDGVVVIDASKLPPKSDPIYRLQTNTTIAAFPQVTTTTIEGRITIQRGQPQTVRFSLTGEQPITQVAGEGIVAWADRRDENGQRSLELTLAESAEPPATPRELTFTAIAREPLPTLPHPVTPVLPGQGDAAAFHGTVLLQADDAVQWEIESQRDLSQLAPLEAQRFQAGPASALTLRAVRSAASPAPAFFTRAVLVGEYDAEDRVVAFMLEGEVEVREPDARLRLLEGAAAITAPVSGPGWRIAISEPPQTKSKAPQPANQDRYELIFAEPGSYPVRIPFDAAVGEDHGWQRLLFHLPAGRIVPVTISGLPEAIEFIPHSQLAPSQQGDETVAWLPASGACDLGWRETQLPREAGRLFVNAFARTEIAVGPGIVRENAEFELRILQGEMRELAFDLAGDGEVTEVTGTHVVGWRVEDREGETRRLAVTLSRPVNETARYTVRSQTAVGAFPATVTPLRLTPVAGDVRYSGLIRVRNEGAVRFEATTADGLMQLAPNQFNPHENNPVAAEQVTVYRFPTPEYGLTLVARQVFPEVTVNQVTLYGLNESDRWISARVELDIREAPLRDWTIQIPDGYALLGVEGTEVVDSITGEAADGRRDLQVIFGQPVSGRALISFRLERSEPAAAGSWALPPLRYPDARTTRGFIGVVTSPGYRVSPESVTGLAETPLNFFPQQTKGLQQAFRQRESDWQATMSVEQMGQSITADLFHLYSLKEGVAYGSVVLNFFVVGAPVNEWRITIPESAGNLAIDGQDVQSWRRDGETVIVSLNRPALGAATLLATFEHPMSNDGGTLQLGQVEPQGVDTERGYLQVVSPLQVKSEAKASETLLALQPNELPPELQLLTNAPTIAVYQYAGRPFSLALDVQWFEQAESIPRVIEFAKLQTQVSRDGQVVTDARYFVKSRGKGALKLQLPDGATLWEAKVGGKTVNARAEDGATLIPLPSLNDPDSATEVSVRYGWAADWANRLRLAAPVAETPVLTTEWTAVADTGRVLVPAGNQLVSTNQVVQRSGIEWLQTRTGRGYFFLTFVTTALAVGLGFIQNRGLGRKLLALLAWLIALGAIALSTLAALMNTGVNRSELHLLAPIAADGHPVFLQVWNLPVWLAMISWWGVALLLIGLVALALGWLSISRYPRLIGLAGWAAIAFGLALQHGGGPLLFAWIGLSLFLGCGRAFLGKWPSSGGQTAAATLLLVAALCIGLPAAQANDTEPLAALGSVEQSLTVGDEKVVAEAAITVEAEEGTLFELLGPRGVLMEFEGEGLRLTKSEDPERPGYLVVAERAGPLRARIRYQFSLPETEDQFALPTGRAAINLVEISRNEGGWGFDSPQAVRIEPIDEANPDQSAARLVLAPARELRILMQPRRRDAAREELRFFAETTNLFVPRPGVVDGHHQVSMNVAQGEIRELALRIPSGFMVGRVSGPHIGSWRFDPDTGLLSIPLAQPQTGRFTLEIVTQQPAGSLPVDLTLEPLRVESAADELGTLAVAFGAEAQPDRLTPTGLTRINFEDFDRNLLENLDAEAKLHRVYRYGAETASLELRVTAVQPEVRVTTSQTLSIGDERIVLAVDCTAEIRRAGLFQLSFGIPDGLEVESVSGEALAYWAESSEGDARRVVMHLHGRTMGEQLFNITFSGQPLGARSDWQVPRFELTGATRSRGTLLVTPEKGLRLRTVDRLNVSQIDPQSAGDLQPGTLAFRLLQADWQLTLGITELDPWVTAQALHTVEVREGQARHRIALAYQVENAAVKALRIALPGLSEESANSVRADGEAVASLARIDESDQWEIRFRRGMIGRISLMLEYQQRLKPDAEQLELQPARPVEVRQLTEFVALRAGGRLQLSIPALPDGWQKADWNAVPPTVRDDANGMPAITLRLGESTPPVAIALNRQAIADSLALRVAQARFATIFSPRGDSATAAELEVRVNEKSSLALVLPEGARLFQVAVNGENMAVVREGATHLFYVTPAPETDEPAKVAFAYEVTGQGKPRRKVMLEAPAFNVPLEDVEWRVVVPDGWELEDAKGSLTLVKTTSARDWSVGDYLNFASSIRKEKEQQTSALISKAGEYLREGDQDKARMALNRAAKTSGIDEATNEDARVQLRNLYNQQAVVGLNTVRQRLYLDNSSRDSAVQNDQIEQAANANPFLKGETEFDLGEVGQLLQGNTLEETSALRRVADRIVSQQIAAEPAPRAIGLTIPERGTEVWFKRSVQVDGERPLELELTLEREQGGGFLSVLGWGLALVLLGAVFAYRRTD